MSAGERFLQTENVPMGHVLRVAQILAMTQLRNLLERIGEVSEKRRESYPLVSTVPIADSLYDFRVAFPGYVVEVFGEPDGNAWRLTCVVIYHRTVRSLYCVAVVGQSRRLIITSPLS